MTSKLATDDSVICDILRTSLQRHVNNNEHQNTFIIDTLNQSSNLIQRIGSEALAIAEQPSTTEQSSLANCDDKDLSSSLRALSTQSLSTCQSLLLLVNQLNSRSKSKKTSGNAWRTLQSVIDRSICIKNNEDSTALFAILSLGMTLSHMNAETASTKMIASAIIPQSPLFERDQIVSYSDDTHPLVKLVARDSIIVMLRRALEYSIDLQTIVKIENTFGVGSDQDNELGIAVANVVQDIFGKGYCSSDPNNNDDEMNSEGISKERASPALALVAQCRPFPHIHADKLIRVAAADLDLWYSAELVVDASIASVTSDKISTAGKMATCYPKIDSSDLIPSTQAIDSRLGDETIAHLAARALIDTALDLRLYRRADLFASKFYSFGGPERYAEARFMHACDTITKVVKRRQPQIIDKQVMRIDDSVSKVEKDLGCVSSANGQQKVGIGEVPINSMPHYIREFSLRRLRSSNMNAAALRLAQLWGMDYEEDPVLLAEEQKKRQLTYIQWSDDGSPGNVNGKCQPLPDLISEAADLAKEFNSLLQSGDTVGFDCEWGDDNGVAVLQLSTCSYSILIDIPALGSNNEGCNVLTATVGTLFAGLTDTRYLIGFGCKEDIKRLRDSPCSRPVHWFPHNSAAQDLRPLIAEVSPSLGIKGGQHLGLSRSTETFLGKQLDKAEQCSDWMARPLSVEQREYAALDAWSCAAIHTKIIEKRYNA
jgi:hypothetical protein